MIIGEVEINKAVAAAKSYIQGLMRAGLLPDTKSVAFAFAVTQTKPHGFPYNGARRVDRIKTDVEVTKHRTSHEKNKLLAKEKYRLTLEAHRILPGSTAADLYRLAPHHLQHGDPIESGSVNHFGLIVSVQSELSDVWNTAIAEVIAQTLLAMCKSIVEQARTSAKENDSQILRNI